MKRTALIRYLQEQGCVFDREGSNHTIYRNPVMRRKTAIPRHREIADSLVHKLCKDLDIPPPTTR
jgi:predicted RNA binding protein YcfA (HicA-like mRNA interferase family)